MYRLTADNREINSGIPAMLKQHNIDVQMKQLYAGDYMIDNKIIIERKTNTDFVQSIVSGRLFTQCAKLRKSKMVPLMIVEGSPFKTAHDVTPEAVKGALLAVNLSWQIPVITSSSKEDTVQLIITAIKQYINPQIFIKHVGRKPKKIQKQQHYFVQSLPGVGPALAKRMLKHFGSVTNLVNADIKMLRQVEGIGKEKATRLYNFFRLTRDY